jgi:DNA-binding SARP family transcriptional activator/tetratricopeptide (TPR) repeat protein
MGGMEFRILGPLEVFDGERSLPLGGAKQRSLLAILLLNANKVVSVERLLDALWGEQQPASGAKTLHVYVSQLRKALADHRVVTQPPGYVLRLDTGELDVWRFEALRARADSAEPREAAELLREALALWRGPPLADFAYDEFAQADISRLEELGASTIEQRIEVDIELGRHRELAGELDGLVAAYPLRERLRRQLMLVLYRSGRQAEALEAYQAARRALVDDLGIEPGRELRELESAILRQDPSLDLLPAADVGVERGQAPRSAFVGRELELNELFAGLDDALAGRGGLYLLVGEPGIGKSRLGEELVRAARGRGFQVLVGRCWEAGGAPAYWPWVQALRAYVRESDTEELRAQLGVGAADVAQIVPELRERFADLPEAPSLDAEGARFRLFDATAEFLRHASRARPLLLALDDLHAADTPSLLLLQFLARELADSRLLVLGALRDVDPIPGAPLKETLAELAREPVTRRLVLHGLSERAVAEYVELTAAGLGSPELISALYEETEGNPLFMTETVRLLAVEGLQATITIPQSVRDVIARRLNHLSEECNRVLELASVLGREFAQTLLTTVSGVSEDELLETVDEAMSARLLTDVPGGPGRLRFAHVLIRDTLYDGLTTVRRVRLHRLAVEALEALYGEESGPHLAELAHHAIAASEFDKALDYARRAGDWTLALLAYEEAARLYELALDAFDLAHARHEGERAELLLSLGEAHARAGNRPSSKRAFLAAAELAKRLGLARAVARAAAGYGGRIVWGRAGSDVRLVPLLEEGLVALDEDDDVELRVRLLARLAGALRDEHSRDRRDGLSREAVELARRSGNEAALAYALEGRATATLAPDTGHETLELFNEVLEVAERIGDPERVIHSRLYRCVVGLREGDLAGVERELAAAAPIAQALRQAPQLWLLEATSADLALARGRLSEAEEHIENAFDYGELAQPEGATPVYRLQRYRVREYRGGLEESEPEIRDLVGEYAARVVFRCALAHIHVRLDRATEARAAVHELSAGDFAALPFDQEWFFGMSLLAETAVLLHESQAAAALYRQLLPWSALYASDHPEGFRGSLSRDLGQLATLLGRWDDAERHFEDALALNARAGALPWVARTQADYARLLRARGNDEERAEKLAAAARATDDALGIRPEAREL